MNKKKLQKQIKQKLENLEKIIEQIRNFNLDPQDDETWDADYYSGLIDHCENALELLKDRNHPSKKDAFNEPLVLEEGIHSLIDEYKEGSEEDEENNDDDE